MPPALPQVGAIDLLWPRDKHLLHTHLHLLFILNSRKSERIKRICGNHFDLTPAPSQSFFSSCHDTGIVQNCSRRGKPIYISASMKGKNKSTTCIKYIHESAFEVIKQMKNCHVSSQTSTASFSIPTINQS